MMTVLVACGAGQTAATLDDWSLEFELAIARGCECETDACYEENRVAIDALASDQPEYADSSRGRALQNEFAACTPPTSELAESLRGARDIICSCRDESCILQFRRAALELHDSYDLRIEETPSRELTASEQGLLEQAQECHANISIGADALASQFRAVGEELCECTSLDCAQTSLAAHRERTSNALIIAQLEEHEAELTSAKNRFCECATAAIGRGVQLELGAFFRHIGLNVQASGSFDMECR